MNSKDKKIRKAVIPAAGYGTRFLPATKAIPKEMFPIVDRPTIEYIVEEAKQSGIEEILIIVSSNKNAILDHFDSNAELESLLEYKGKNTELEKVRTSSQGIDIHYVRQKTQNGLGDAVRYAKTFVGDEPFALLLGDDIYMGKQKPMLGQLVEAYNVVKSSVIGVLPIEGEEIEKYGVVSPSAKQDVDSILNIQSLVEKPAFKDAPSNLAIGGRYILTPMIFDLLENQKPGAGGEIQLTDSINELTKYEKVYAKEADAYRYDIGSRIGFIEATLDYAYSRDDLREQLIELLNEKGYTK